VSATAPGLAPALVMAGVAAVMAVGAGVVLTRPGTSESAIYGRRIVGTMLGAGAIILGSFAYALGSVGMGK
jgi:hypothetical protein